jgi:hypothetical protein
MDPLHVALITVHAGFAVACFVLGCTLMGALPRVGRSRRFAAYYVCAMVAVVALLTVVIVDFGHLDVTRRIAFTILSVLAVYLAVRTEQARRTLATRRDGWRPRFIGHVGFVLISLFDGFCIVSAIDLGMPPVVIVLVAVLGVALGVLWIRTTIARERRREAAGAVADGPAAA